MTSKNKSMMMKAIGGALAVGSAAAMMSASKTTSKQAKKTMKKTADKVIGIVDTVASFM